MSADVDRTRSTTSIGRCPPSCSPPARGPACGPPARSRCTCSAARRWCCYVLDALADCEPRRAVVVVGHGAERVTKKLQEDGARSRARLRRAARAAGHRRRRQRRAHRLPRRRDRSRRRRRARAARRHPAAPGRDHRHLVAEHRRTGAACTLLTAADGRPDRVRPRRPGHRRSRRAASSSTPTPPTKSARSTRSTRRSTASARACSPRRCDGSAPRTPRASTTSPTSSAVLHDAGYPVVVRGRRRRRPRRRASTTGSSSPSAEAELRHRTNECWLRRGVTMLDPERTYIDATVELGTDVTLFPGTMLQGRTRRRRGRRDRARHPARRLRRRRGRRGRADRRRATPRSARARGWARSPCSSPGARSPSDARTGAFYTAEVGDATSGPETEGNVGHGARHARSVLHLVSGRANLPLAEEIAERLGVELGDAQPGGVRQRRAALPLRRVDPRHRRLHHPEPLRRRRAARSTTRSWSS